MASASGCFVPGDAKQALAGKPRTHTEEMLRQSSKFDLSEPTEISSTPRRHTPSETLNVEDSPATSGPKPSAVKRATPPPGQLTRSRHPDIRRQLFPYSAKAKSPKPKAEPKPDGYWRPLVDFSKTVVCVRVCMYIHQVMQCIRLQKLRVRRHFQPNSKGEVKVTARVLELGSSSEGRTFYAMYTACIPHGSVTTCSIR